MNFDFVTITNEKHLDEYIDAILALQDSCTKLIEDKSWYIPSDKQEFYDYIMKYKGIVILALIDNCVAAVISAGLDDNHYKQAKEGGAKMPNKKFLYLSLVCVNARFRGHHLQYELMMKTLEFAKKNGYKGCWCRVHPNNIYSVHNIEKAGLNHFSDYTTDEGWPRRIYCKKFGWF